MIQISLTLENYTPLTTTCKSERAEIVKTFVDSINAERKANRWGYRIGEKWKKTYPATGRGIAMKLSHVKGNSNLRDFLSECRQARSFSEYFFGRLKVSNYKK